MKNNLNFPPKYFYEFMNKWEVTTVSSAYSNVYQIEESNRKVNSCKKNKTYIIQRQTVQLTDNKTAINSE